MRIRETLLHVGHTSKGDQMKCCYRLNCIVIMKCKIGDVGGENELSITVQVESVGPMMQN